MKAVTLEESTQMKGTPRKTIIKPKYFGTPDNLEFGKKIPSFVSGYVEGQPIYTIVRVVPEEIVAGIEDEISIQEKKDYQKQTTEMTLFE